MFSQFLQAFHEIEVRQELYIAYAGNGLTTSTPYLVDLDPPGDLYLAPLLFPLYIKS